MSFRFQPTIASEWVGAAAVGLPRPQPVTGPVSVEVREQFVEYNLSHAPLRFPAVQEFERVFAETERYNELRPYAGRRLVGVTGESYSGKTTTVLMEAVRQCSQAGMELFDNGRVAPVPWVYVVASPTGGGRSLAKSIADFLAVPVQPRDTAQDIVNRLGAVMKPIGVRAIFIDDAHFLRVQGGSGDVAHVVKHLITCLPVTLVMAGVDLKNHPVATPTRGDMASPGAQIQARTNWFELQPWERGSDEADEQWSRLMRTARHAIAFPRESQWRLNSQRAAREIQRRSGSRPSVAIEWMLHGAVAAIRRDANLTYPLMQAVAHDLPAVK